MAEYKIDRRALKEIVVGLRNVAENDWCVACGAAKSSYKLDYPEQVVQEAAKQFLDPKGLRDFIATIKDAGIEQAWCVACGAGAAASPLSQVLPAEITDDFIDGLAQKLLPAVKAG